MALLHMRLPVNQHGGWQNAWLNSKSYDASCDGRKLPHGGGSDLRPDPVRRTGGARKSEFAESIGGAPFASQSRSIHHAPTAGKSDSIHYANADGKSELVQFADPDARSCSEQIRNGGFGF